MSSLSSLIWQWNRKFNPNHPQRLQSNGLSVRFNKPKPDSSELMLTYNSSIITPYYTLHIRRNWKTAVVLQNNDNGDQPISMPNPFPFKRTNDSGPAIFFLTYRPDRRICQTKFPLHIGFLFPIFNISYHFKLSFDAQNPPFVRYCGHVVTLPVSCLLKD